MADGRFRPSWLEILYGLFAFWTYQIAFFVLFRPGAAEGGEFRPSDPLGRAANITVLLGALFFAARRRGFVPFLWRHGKLPGLIVLYCLCSTVWSLDPVATARRSISLATCFLFGFFALAAYGPRGTIRIYGWSLFVAALASWVLLPVVPGKLYDNEGVLSAQALRTFHGVFTQKNELSVEMLMGFCCWAYLGIVAPRKGEVERWFWPVAMALMLSAMVYARGTTSMLATMLVAVAVVLMRWRSWRVALVVYSLLGAGALVLGSIVVVDHELLFAALGKDPSMTGRLPLWLESARAVAARPILGWGYNAFWTPNSVEARYIWQRIGWPAPNAHNGLLELGLDFGLVGGALYLAMMGRIAFRALLALGDAVCPEARFLVLILIAMLVENLDEGTIGWPDALAILVAFWCGLTSVWGEARVRRAMAHGLGRTTRAPSQVR